MDTVFSLVGDGFALVVADASAARSILVFKHDEDKILALDSHKLMVGAGVPADCATFNEYVQKNLKLYELNNDIKLSTRGAANYIRGELATAMRKGPYQTNLLLAGFDPEEGVSLFLMDYMAALSKVNFGAHGYAAAFILSVFDRDWVKGMDLAAEPGGGAQVHTRAEDEIPDIAARVYHQTSGREWYPGHLSVMT
eukprot:CAMPEP_0173352856 /NCGR_PEP_ID=MMETSP1144-20121109/16250_1 /TAXON_ID=483371 /ORGANISM="non described non described, Strain CCMP2298" /LENGTH=195 /DNA_ID=CAMNT_0014301117 /DNA_START=88 /DNA_END=670 /DNA_ORIENTATION=-